jgi:hypothetical protein
MSGPNTMMMGDSQDFQYDMNINMGKNMSHSSGGVGGFGMNSSASKGGA